MAATSSYFNKYTQRIVEEHHVTRRSIVNHNNDILNNLPANRLNIFECAEAEIEYCLRARFSVFNFEAGDTAILISLNFTIDLSRLGWFKQFFLRFENYR